MSKRTYHIINKLEAERFADLVHEWQMKKPLQVTVEHQDTRSLEANAKMWAMLHDISRQITIPVSYPNGETVDTRMDPEDWKNYLSGHLNGLKQVPGIQGGMVMLGKATSKMSIKKMHELIDFIQMFGDSRQVIWSNTEHQL